MALISAGSSAAKWAAVVLYCSLTASNGFQWITLSTLVSETKEFFRLTNYQFNIIMSMYSYVYCGGVVFGCVAFQRGGAHLGLVIGALLNCLGALLRVLCAALELGYAPLLLAQVICGFAEVFFLSAAPLLASTWFPPTQRTTVTSISSMSNSVGIALGFVIPSLAVHKGNQGRAAFLSLFAPHAAITVAIALAAVFVVPARPVMSPSVTSTRPTSIREMLPAIRRLLVFPPFVLLSAAVGLALNSLWSFASYLPQCLRVFGVSTAHSGMIGFVMTLSGMFSASLVARVIDRHRNYKLAMLMLTLLGLSTFSALLLALLYSAHVPLTLALSFVLVPLMGMFVSATIPVQLEFAVELTYPLPEGVVTGFLFFLSHVLAPPVSYIGVAVLADNATKERVVVLVMIYMIIISLSALPTIAIRDELKRLELEKVAASPELKSGELEDQ